MPLNRLAFVGLGYFVAAGANAYIQGLYVGHAIAQADFLPRREEALREIAAGEEKVRAAGFEPFEIGQFVSLSSLEGTRR